MTEKRKLALVCDDDKSVRLLLRQTLMLAGLEVIEAADGKQSVEQYFAHQPDIILLDVEMPHFTGFEVCEQIRQSTQGKTIPIIMVTVSEDRDSIDKAQQVGATDFMSKPFNWPILAQRVQYVLRANSALVTMQKNQQKLHDLAHFDVSTGLANRQQYLLTLKETLEQASKDKHYIAVLVVDIDRFNRINDTLGHTLGDKLLQVLSQRLCNQLATSENSHQAEVALLGGDEFAIYSNCIDSPQQAKSIATETIATITQPVILGDHEVVVTPSIGIAVYPTDGKRAETLLKHAERAMYDAKKHGGCNYKSFVDTMSPAIRNQLKLESELRYAIANHQFQLFYQPQIDVTTGKVVNFEALLRWNHPLLGQLSPTHFLSVAEENGLIGQIGDWVLTNVCQQLRHWQDQQYPINRVAVKISGLQFHKSNFCTQISELLESYQLDANRLELQLTENVVMSDVDVNIERLIQLKNIGVYLTVDHFGTGYSSLSYLKRFPIDALKIDRSFIQGIVDNEDDKAIVGAISALAEQLRLNVIAEGVEQQQQINILKQFHCHLLQGFLFSPAIPADAASQLLFHKYEI